MRTPFVTPPPQRAAYDPAGAATTTLRGQFDELVRRLMQAPAVMIRVAGLQGSGPREPGAWMAVFAESEVGTIGGGHLEYEAIAHARALLGGAPLERRRRFALGPSLGQCCGGVVHLEFEPVDFSDAARLTTEWHQAQTRQMPVALFGGGHVGRAIVALLGTLPVRTLWVDSRDGIFPGQLPANARTEHSEPVQGAVAALVPGSRVLIMSFSHAEDLDIVAACLRRQRERHDLPYIGLIGSKTKWATFRHRLQARGFGDAELAHVTCPIGVPGIAGKEPEVIAVAVAAQLLQTAG